MKVIIDFKEKRKLKYGDILMYEDDNFTNLSKDLYLFEVKKEISALKEQLENERLEHQNALDLLNTQLEELRASIAALNAEIEYDRGNITEEEYEEVKSNA